MARTEVVTYTAASLSSPDALRVSCDRDEGRLGKIIRIDLARIENSNGEKAVAVTYEEVRIPTDINIGHLIFKSFNGAADKNRKVDEILQTLATPVLPADNPSERNSVAKVFIGNTLTDILVYREKKP